MKVLSVASECAPLVKTGGLADVVGALPGALAPLGVDMRVLLPGYPGVMAGLSKAREVMVFDALLGGPARLLSAQAAGLDLLVLDAPHFFDRAGGPYQGPDGRDWRDNPERFAALCLAAARLAEDGADGWRPDVIHGHDWQAGLAPEYLRGTDIPTVMTIHNIAFMGMADAGRIAALRLDPARFTQDGYEFWGQVSALKAGLVAADALTTVSPRYALELMTPEFGMGLDGLMRHRRADLHGILNGIDETVWTPPYADRAGKAAARAALRRELGLPASDGPLCIVVSRLTQQKGLDLLLEALPVLTKGGGQLALLGSGDPGLEGAFRAAAEAHAGVAVRIGYDEALSHRMMAGGDAILIPSRFEPCGLTQLYGLRFGTLPVVALTGGLADTVIDASPAALTGKVVATGIQFHPVTADALRAALTRMLALWAQPPVWDMMVANAMAQPVGWDVSARAYADLYRDLIART